MPIPHTPDFLFIFPSQFRSYKFFSCNTFGVQRCVAVVVWCVGDALVKNQVGCPADTALMVILFRGEGKLEGGLDWHLAKLMDSNSRMIDQKPFQTQLGAVSGGVFCGWGLHFPHPPLLKNADTEWFDLSWWISLRLFGWGSHLPTQFGGETTGAHAFVHIGPFTSIKNIYRRKKGSCTSWYGN